MSSIRFNEKELLLYALSTDNATVQGCVRKKSKKYKHKSLWLVLKGNLLFIFKSSSAPLKHEAPHSCYVLESCYPNVTDTGFSITFKDMDKDRILSFVCNSEHSTEWVRFVKEANFKHLRNQLMYYRSMIKQMSCTSSTSSFDSVNLYTPRNFIVLIKLQGLICSQYQCDVKVHLNTTDGKTILRSEGIRYCSNEMNFFTTCIINSSTFRDPYILSIYRTSHAAKQHNSYIKVYDVEVCFADTILPDAISGECVAPIESPNASGMANMSLVSSCDVLSSAVKLSNHRSSCLFSETILPLSVSEKDEVFSTVFTKTFSRHFAVCKEAPDDILLLEEAVLSLVSTPAITTAYLSFLLEEDKQLMEVLSNFPDDIMDYSNLQFRIDVNDQHLHSLTHSHRTSLRRSNYHSLYRPSNLALYRAKIMNSQSHHYEVFDKVVISCPTKSTDAAKEGGLDWMLSNEMVRVGFETCRELSTMKERISGLRKQLQYHMDILPGAMGNFNADEMMRHWNDIEAISNSVIKECTRAEVADLVISLSSILGDNCPLYVWVSDEIKYIEPSWSVWPISRSVTNQVEALGKECNSFNEEFRSDLWVENIFLPCLKLQRDLVSLIKVSVAGLDFKIHMTQNAIAPMNRFVMRSDAVTSQLLTAVITSFYSAIYTYMDDVFFWLHILNVGFFVQIESLLSYRGAERVLLEDLNVAVNMLRRNVRLEIVCGGTAPYLKGSRYSMVVCVPVPVKIYALLLDVCQSHNSSRKISIHACLCNQLLSKTEEDRHSEMEQGFIRKVNSRSLDYVGKVVGSNTTFYNNIEDVTKLDQVSRVIEQLGSSWDEAPGEVLTLYQRLGKLLCAGQVVVCATGLDNTSMSVSYSLHRHLREEYGVGGGSGDEGLLKGLRQGVLFERAGAVRSYPYYDLPGRDNMHKGYFC